MNRTLLPAIQTLPNQQNEPTNVTMQQLKYFIHYSAFYPDARTQYFSFNMNLQILSNFTTD